jgi:hypothetical protein
VHDEWASSSSSLGTFPVLPLAIPLVDSHVNTH